MRHGIAEYYPVVWEVIDSSKTIASFDFTGAPHCLYYLKVINPHGATAILPYRFLVERENLRGGSLAFENPDKQDKLWALEVS